jgi:hypothetical protein
MVGVAKAPASTPTPNGEDGARQDGEREKDAAADPDRSAGERVDTTG